MRPKFENSKLAKKLGQLLLIATVPVLFLFIFIENANAAVSNYDYTDTVNNKAYQANPDTTFPPTWTSNVWGGTEVSDYSKLTIDDGNYVIQNGASNNYEPYIRFNFTINEAEAGITSVNITFNGNITYGGGEDGDCFIADFSTSTFTKLWDVPTEQDYTYNITTDMGNYIDDGNKQLVVLCMGKSLEGSPDGVYADLIYVNVSYTSADATPPTWSEAQDNATAGKVYRGQVVNMSAVWADAALDFSWLSTNETGNWRIYNGSFSGPYGSPRDIAGTQALVNFSWMNDTGRPRVIGWRMYANDTVGNINGTDNPSGVFEGNFTIWGWSNISRMTPVPGTTYDTMSRQNITLIAFVNDSNSSGSGPIENYMVNFSWRNATHEIFLGTNFTNSSGYARWEWNISGLLSGTYFPQVNISINRTLYYNASEYNYTNTTINLIAIYTPNISQTFSTSSQHIKPASFSRIRGQLFLFDTTSLKLLSAFREPAQFLTSSQSFINALGTIRDIISSFSVSGVIERTSNFVKEIRESFSIQSITSRLIVLYRDFSNTFSLTANVIKIASFPRNFVQGFSTSDAVTRLLAFSRNATNSFSTSAITTRITVLFKNMAGSFTLTGNVVETSLFSRVATGYLSIDAVRDWTFGVLKNFGQSLSITDMTSRLFLFSKNIGQTFDLNQVTTRIFSFQRLSSITLSMNIVSEKIALFSRNVASSLNIQQVISKFTTIPKTISQVININEAVSRFLTIPRSVSQAFGLNDIVVRVSAFSRSITAQLAITEAAQRLLISVRSVIQSISVDSVVGRTMLALKSISQNLTANALVSKFVTIPRTVSQTFTFNSSTTLGRVYSRLATITANLFENTERSISANRVTTNIIAVTDSAQRLLALARSSIQSLVVNNIVGRVITSMKSITQSLTANDIVSKFITYPKLIANSFTMSAFTTRLTAFSRAITGRFTLTSVGLVPSGPTEILVNIFFSVTDTIQRNILATRLLSQTLSLNAITSRVSLIYKSLSQTFSTSAITLPLGLFSRTIGQAVDLTEITTRLIILSRNMNQFFNLNSIMSSVASFPRTFTQAFTSSATTTVGRVYSRFATITADLVENIQRTIYLNRITTSILTVNSYVERVFQPLRSITQSFSITSSMSRAIVLTRSAIQSFTADIIASKFTTLAKSVINSFNLQTITSRIFTAQRAISQSTAVNAVTSKLIILSRNITNSIILSNIAARSVNFMKVATQPFTLSSITEKVSAFSRATTNIFSISSITGRLLSLNRNFVGQFILTSIGQGRTGDVFPIFVSAFFTVSDNIQRGFIFSRGLIQSISLTEITSRFTILFRNMSQSFVISDTVIRFRQFPTIVSQSFNLSTVTSSLKTFSRSLTQTLSTSAISSRTSLFLRAVSQTASINQVTIRVALLSKNITQLFNLNSSIARIFTISRTITQAIPLNQAITRSLAFSRTITGAFNLNEITARIASLSRIVTVDFSTNTATIRFLSFPKNVSQAFSITDVTSRLTIISRSVTEGISTAVITGRFFVLTRSFTQIFSIREYVSSVSSQVYERITTLAIRINDSAIRTYQAIRLVREVFNINAISSRAINLFRSFTSYFTFTFGVNISCPPLCLPVPPSPTPSGPSGGGGITGVSAVEIKKEVSVEFIKWSILSEVIPGQATVQDIIIKNKGNEIIKELKIEVGGIPQEWVFVTPETIDLGSGEVKSFTISIAVPKDAEPGEYRVIVTLKNSGVDDKTFFILRIRSFVRADTPIVTRVIDIDYSKNRTEVDLTVSNTYKNISLIQVLEDVPKDLAKTSDEIEFITSSTEILRKDPLIQWDLLNMFAGESRTISYAVKNILKEYSAYIYFPVREMNVIIGKIPSGFKLVDFDIPPLFAGRSEVVTFTIKNIDNVTHSLQFYIGLPKGWKADPEKIEANISANEVRKFRVSIVVPEGAVKGSYIVQTLFFWDEDSFIRDIQVTVARPINMLLVLIIIIGVGTIVYIVYRVKRRREIRPAIEKIRRIAYEVGER